MSKDQTILIVDDAGNFSGEYESKIVSHTGDGKHHLAITVFIYNSKGELLMQRRRHQIFDNFWDNTASTHQLHREDGSDETDEQATQRALKDEYGIDEVENLKNLGGFNYFQKYGELCENEHCKLLIGEYNGKIHLNPEVGYEYKWMKKAYFLKDLKKNPEKYTPWCKESIGLLKKADFFKS